MSRLIDADEMAINESEAYMNAQLKVTDKADRMVNEVVHKKIQMLIADTPTVDAVEVVRCKNCKHHRWEQEPCHGKTIHYCLAINRQVQKDFFCANGERRSNDY